MRAIAGLLLCLLGLACREQAAAPSLVQAATTVTPPVPAAEPSTTRLLPVPPRAQALESPPDGWCGETAIQEGLLHFGLWAPQAYINKSGRPSHPDLYSPDIPVALAALGVEHTFYKPKGKGWEDYVRFVQSAIDEGDPVLAGVKILPTQHPEWGLDHFVLVVGYGTGGLLVNTTWGRRLWANDKTTKGISFANASYAIRLHGLSDRTKSARLEVVGEDAKTVALRVSCPDDLPVVARDGKPTGESAVTIPRDRATRFSCLPID